MDENRLDWLLRCADDLNSRYPSRGAIDVKQILGKLSVPLVKRVDSDASKSYGELTLTPPDKYVVNLIRNSDEPKPLTRWERFTVAHELAHLLLIKRFRWNPKVGSSYYECEQCCDAFAGRLLVPRSELGDLRADQASDLLEYIARKRKKLFVSWEVFARELIPEYPGIAAFQVRRESLKTGKLLFHVEWGVSSLPAIKLGRQRRIRRLQPLWKALQLQWSEFSKEQYSFLHEGLSLCAFLTPSFEVPSVDAALITVLSQKAGK